MGVDEVDPVYEVCYSQWWHHTVGIIEIQRSGKPSAFCGTSIIPLRPYTQFTGS